VGVDAEHIDARHAGPGPAGLVFAAAERRNLAATTGDAAVALFFRYWSLREAYPLRLRRTAGIASKPRLKSASDPGSGAGSGGPGGRAIEIAPI